MVLRHLRHRARRGHLHRCGAEYYAQERVEEKFRGLLEPAPGLSGRRRFIRPFSEILPPRKFEETIKPAKEELEHTVVQRTREQTTANVSPKKRLEELEQFEEVAVVHRAGGAYGYCRRANYEGTGREEITNHPVDQ